MSNSSQKDLFSSLISNIKSYTGDDPLRPWIQGIRKIHQSLPPHIVDEKLPRFLQKCVKTFESDRRYHNDSRYLDVWIQLMDYVEDAKVLLKKMENKQIGVKRAKFYIAYALYYEKRKKFEDAEKMYQLGVNNLAVPVEDLQKSYDQFVHRMKLLTHRRAKVESIPNTAEITLTGCSSQKTLKDYQLAESSFQADQAEENSHHASSSLQVSTEMISRSLNQVKPRSYNRERSIEMMADEEVEESGEDNHNTPPKNSFFADFKILANDGVDDEDEDDDDDDDDGIDGSHGIAETESRCYDARLNEDTVIRRLKEDTVIRKFMGSTVYDEPKVEDACHHGLVDPTVNLKQAMDDINGMFGQTLNFLNARRPKKKEEPFDRKPDNSNRGFFILADDDIEMDVKGHVPAPISHSSNGEGEFLEPTVMTKEAMDEFNDLFGKSQDFKDF